MIPAPLQLLLFVKKNQLQLYSYFRNALRLRPESTPTLCLLYTKDEHGSGLDWAGSGLKPIFAGQGWIGLQFF